MAAGRGEDVAGEEEDVVLAGQLLDRHEAERQQEGQQGPALQQLGAAAHRLRRLALQQRLRPRQFRLRRVLRSAQPPQRLVRLLAPSWRPSAVSVPPTAALILPIQ